MDHQLFEDYSPNTLITEHSKALQSAQEIFMETESSPKLRNTFKKTPHTSKHFELGQAVY